MSSLRHRLGALLYDWLPFELRLRRDWTLIRNRSERIDADANGVRCDWRWTSDLHVARVFPSTGRRLMRRAFAVWPIALADAVAETDAPRVSFIIGHRGMERLPHLLATIRSIAGQTETPVECIVVEQSVRPESREHLPAGVRYIHTPVAASDPYCRSCAFNAGARQARGEVLILHDNDIVVPRRYAAAALEAIRSGFDFANLIRFLFYVPATEVTLDAPPERIVQNTQGGSIVARREAYFDIGGYDEDFVGWGGEDNDFWDRASTRRVQTHASVPMVHLHHAPQPEKDLGDRAPAVARYRELEGVPAHDRIARLREKQRFPRIGAMQHGLITTIIPVHNRPAMLREAVASVLAQTYRPIEILIVDDASTDDTLAVADELARTHEEVRVVRRATNGGAGAARESGRALARGELIQHLDSDDVLLPRKFEMQVAALRAHPECGAAYGWTRLRHRDGRVEETPWKRTGERMETMFPAMLALRWWDTPNPLYRASVIAEAGPWTTLRIEEDWEYDCRIAARGTRLAYCAEWVCEVREHDLPRLSGHATAAILRDRARAHLLMLAHARTAHLSPALPEMRQFARELFHLGRQCGAAGLADESRRLIQASHSIADAKDVRVYALMARVLGWRIAGRAARLLDD